MKKAALITFCNNFAQTNYGQALQCYALFKKLEDLELNVEVIPYREKNGKDVIKYRFPFDWMNMLYENWFQANVVDAGNSERVKKFQKFMRNNVKLSARCYNINDVEKISDKCDMLICGSDQIWNPRWINDFYTLNFGKMSQKRIAYASSGIVPEYDKTVINKYTDLGKQLEKFNYISLREKSSVETLKKYTKSNIENVLDPIFLLKANEWDRFSNYKLINEPYILCYNLCGIRPYKMILRKLKDYYKAQKIVYIKSNAISSEFPSDFVEINNAGPKEFLSLIKNSLAVCTDSFHGLALSINYNKQVRLFNNLNAGTFFCENRTKDLLEKMNIKNIECNSINDIKEARDINYSEVNKLLEMERKKSLDFLKKAISEG